MTSGEFSRPLRDFRNRQCESANWRTILKISLREKRGRGAMTRGEYESYHFNSHTSVPTSTVFSASRVSAICG